MFMVSLSQNREDVLSRANRSIASSLTKERSCLSGGGSILVVAEQSTSVMQC